MPIKREDSNHITSFLSLSSKYSGNQAVDVADALEKLDFH